MQAARAFQIALPVMMQRGGDLNQRLQSYAQAQQTLVTDLPVVPLFFRGRMVLVKPYVQNMVITGKDDYPGWSLLGQVFLTK